MSLAKEARNTAMNKQLYTDLEAECFLKIKEEAEKGFFSCKVINGMVYSDVGFAVINKLISEGFEATRYIDTMEIRWTK